MCILSPCTTQVEKLARGDPVPAPRKRRRALADGAAVTQDNASVPVSRMDGSDTHQAPRKSKKLNYHALNSGASVLGEAV